MAFGDYHPCDRCGERKTFYDATMNYETHSDGSITYDGHKVIAICGECSRTHRLAIVPLTTPDAHHD